MKTQLALLLAAALSSAGCAGPHRKLETPAVPLSEPLSLCRAEQTTGCREPGDVEAWLSEPKLEVLDADPPPGGAQGTLLLTVRTPRGEVLRAKWRGPSTSNMLNEPRKELAAYAVQRLFLSPHEYVAPPTVVRCFSVEQTHRFPGNAETALAGSDCVLGYLSSWVEGVKSVEAARTEGLLREGSGIFSPVRFRDDATYRGSLSRANLFMFAVNHGDPHPAQFILEPGESGLRVYVVDNSVAFLSIKTPLLPFLEDWSDVRVPAVPTKVLERMRGLDERDYALLGALAEFEFVNGKLQRLPTPSGRMSQSGQDWDGQRLVIGLTPREIDLVRERIAELLRRFPSEDSTAK